MLIPLIAQISESQSLKLTGEVGIGILFAGKLMDLWNNYKEGRDRKKHTEEFIRQTERLQNIDLHLASIKDSQGKDTQTILLGRETQKEMVIKIDRIDRGVRDLKLMAGVPETETTIPEK